MRPTDPATRDSRVLSVPPLALTITSLAGQRVLVGGRGPRRCPRTSAVIVSVSVGLVVVSVGAFRRRGTTVDPRRDAVTTSLVTHGANAVTRNPMYVGMAGVQVAHAVHLGRPLGLVPLGLFLIWMDVVQIPAEESVLRLRFGESYETYTRTVRRWWGRYPARRDHRPSGV